MHVKVVLVLVSKECPRTALIQLGQDEFVSTLKNMLVAQ